MKVVAGVYAFVVVVFVAAIEVVGVMTLLGARDAAHDTGSPVAAVLAAPVLLLVAVAVWRSGSE